MNCRAVRLIFEVPGLSVWEFAVLCAIARTVDNRAFIGHPSIETIAQYANISLRQVQRTLPLLVGRGLISRTTQGHGKGCKNVFQVELDTLRSLIKKDAQQSPISQPVEDRDNPGMGDSQTLITGGIDATLTPQKGLQKRKSPSGIAKAATSVIAKRISLAVNPEGSPELSEWAQRIAVAHPRSRIEHIGPMEVPTRDLTPVVAAILLEAGKGGMTQKEAGRDAPARGRRACGGGSARSVALSQTGVSLLRGV